MSEEPHGQAPALMAGAMAIDTAIADYYQRAPEESRLERGAFLLEALRTRELIARHAPPAPGTVLDIGGAAGTYALWLAEAGYTVHLLDATPRLVQEAERRSAASARPLASCRVGDARATAFETASADGALLLGPLYHLTEADDRLRALAEARRLLKPGGWLFAAAISRWASLLGGLAEDALKEADFATIVDRDLRDGQHRNPSGRLDFFTTAYFHRPDDLRAEAEAAGLQVQQIYGLEGPGWLFPDIDARLADPRQREELLSALRRIETEPSLLGLSAHLLLVARRAADDADRII